MDISVLVVLLVFSLVLTVLGFMGRKPGWALLILFGGIIAALTALTLLNDATLTQAGASSALASANGNFVSDFNAISSVPILIAGGELIVAIRRIFKI